MEKKKKKIGPYLKNFGALLLGGLSRLALELGLSASFQLIKDLLLLGINLYYKHIRFYTSWPMSKSYNPGGFHWENLDK